MTRSRNWAKIRRAVKEIEREPNKHYLEDLAADLDAVQDVLEVMRSDNGSKFRDHFRREAAGDIHTLFAVHDAGEDVGIVIERLRTKLNFLKMLTGLENEEEILQSQVDELIEESISR